MNILILGGNSARHHQWIRELGTFLAKEGNSVVLHDYRHWATGEKSADVEYEAQQLKGVMSGTADYLVIAKSVGTVIATLAVAKGSIQPVGCIFLGVPYEGIAGATREFDPSLSSLPQTIVLQNEHDPLGSAELVKNRLAHAQNITVISIPGDTHDYLDFSDIASYVQK